MKKYLKSITFSIIFAIMATGAFFGYFIDSILGLMTGIGVVDNYISGFLGFFKFFKFIPNPSFINTSAFHSGLIQLNLFTINISFLFVIFGTISFFIFIKNFLINEKIEEIKFGLISRIFLFLSLILSIFNIIFNTETIFYLYLISIILYFIGYFFKKKFFLKIFSNFLTTSFFILISIISIIIIGGFKLEIMSIYGVFQFFFITLILLFLNKKDRFFISGKKILLSFLTAITAQGIVFLGINFFVKNANLFFGSLSLSEIYFDKFTYWDLYFYFLIISFFIFILFFQILFGIKKATIKGFLSHFLIGIIPVLILINTTSFFSKHISKKILGNQQEICGNLLPANFYQDIYSSCFYKQLEFYGIKINKLNAKNNEKNIEYTKYFVLNGGRKNNSIIFPNTLNNQKRKYIPIGAQGGGIMSGLLNENYEIYFVLNDENKEKIEKIILTSKDSGMKTFASYWLYSYYQKKLETNKSFKIMANSLFQKDGDIISKLISTVVLNQIIKTNSNPEKLDYIIKNNPYKILKAGGLTGSAEMAKLKNISEYDFLLDKKGVKKFEQKYREIILSAYGFNSPENTKKILENNGTIKGKLIINGKVFKNKNIGLMNTRKHFFNGIDEYGNKNYEPCLEQKFKKEISQKSLNNCGNLENKKGIKESEIRVLNSTKTDSEGNFEFTGVRQGLYYLVFKMDGEKEYLEKLEFENINKINGLFVNTKNKNINLGDIILKN